LKIFKKLQPTCKDLRSFLELIARIKSYDKEAGKMIQLFNKYDHNPEFRKYIQVLDEEIKKIEIYYEETSL